LQLITSLEIIASLSTDAKWLSWLKYQFTEAMRKSDRMNNQELHVTLNDFLQNFYFKEPFLAHRLFEYLDKDKSGTLTLHEFINGLEVVVNGTQEQKIEFLFKVFDIDGDGVIDFNEMRMMLKCCLQETPSLDMEETVDDLTAILFKENDRDNSGNISLDELKHAFKKHESLFKTLTVSTSIWIKPKFINKSHRNSTFHKMKNAIVNKRGFGFYLLNNFIRQS
jgi:Ca2+-binding EF-hand superfamily protein